MLSQVCMIWCPLKHLYIAFAEEIQINIKEKLQEMLREKN